MKNPNVFKLNYKLLLSLFLAAFILGLFQMWGMRHVMNADGLSYLNIAESYINLDYKNAVSPYWSPMYSWVIALFEIIFKPSKSFEFTMIHILNFLIYLLAFYSFTFFYIELNKFTNEKTKINSDLVSIQQNLLLLISFSLFIMAMLKFTTIWMITPDLLLSFFIFLISGLSLKIVRTNFQIKDLCFLGIILGISYLVKTVMFALAFVYILSFFFTGKDFKKVLKKQLLIISCFLLVSSPYIFLISKQKEKFTFGDSGKLNYIWQVNDVTAFYMVHWQGGEGIVGNPIHTTRKILKSPDIYEFSGPVSGTYPPWFNPSYWYEGANPNLQPKYFINFLIRNLKEYFSIFIIIPGMIILFLIYLIIKSQQQKVCFERIKQFYFILFPALSSILLYAIVYPELRYIAQFFVVIFTVLFNGLIFKKNFFERKNYKFIFNIFVSLIFIIIFFANYINPDYSYLIHIKSLINRKEYFSNVHYDTYLALKKAGLKEGDKVATVGYGFYSFWAYLGKNKIVAEIPNESVSDFWNIENNKKEEVLNIFKDLKVKALITDFSPSINVLNEWKKIDKTNFYVMFLD